jgi:hypothetical protein
MEKHWWIMGIIGGAWRNINGTFKNVDITS